LVRKKAAAGNLSTVDIEARQGEELCRESLMTKGPATAERREELEANVSLPKSADGKWITWLSIGLSVEAVLLNLLQLPSSLNFGFLFGDTGANITAQYLVTLGYRPAVDFGYHYGLLPLLLGRLWFSVAGATPIGYQSAMVVTSIILAFGLARFAENLRLSWTGIAFIAAALLIAIRPYYWNFAHALEAALLCHAIAAQAGGRTRTALALTTAAVFAKPSMGYFYAALLLVGAALKMRASGGLTLKAVEKVIVPSITVAAALLVAIICIYGPLPLWHTLLPLTGAHAYRVQHLGLFADGIYFLHPPGVRPGFYLGTFSGVWILGTLWLIGAAAFCAWRLIEDSGERSANEIAAEMVLTCGLLQLAFVAILFGTAQSWAYYSYILVMGIAASSKLSHQAGNVVVGLAFLSLLSQKATWQDSIRAWRTTRPDPDALGLWTTPEEADEWARVRRLATGKSATILSCDGSAEVEFPEVRKPVSLFLIPGLPTSVEIERKAAEVSSSSIVITPDFSGTDFCQLPKWPEFAAALTGFRIVSNGKYFKVLSKDDNSGPHPDAAVPTR
jgi:hypothetical protein